MHISQDKVGASEGGFSQAKRFVQQAMALDQVDPTLAFYCRMHAVRLALAVKEKRSPADLAFLNNLMGELERTGEYKLSANEAPAYVLQAAQKVIQQAEDRQTARDSSAGPLFQTAATLFEAMAQFGPLQPEVVDWIQHCQTQVQEPAGFEAKSNESPEDDTFAVPTAYPSTAPSFDTPPSSIPAPSPSFTPSPSLTPSPAPSVSSERERVLTAQLQEAQSHLLQERAKMKHQLEQLQELHKREITQLNQQHQRQLKLAAQQTPASPPTGDSIVVTPSSPPLERAATIKEADRLMKHATAALRFGDVPTAAGKLRDSLAMLLNHNSAS